ncbi:MAG: 30S ribosomal protein S6 [Chloroflexi bacterium]|nr:30S ribosomal protein S6 [Chloroflexota bacterium]
MVFQVQPVRRIRPYELVFIAHPDLDEKTLIQLVERVKNEITRLDGTIRSTKMWGKRPLAYPIRKRREGYYVFMEMDMPADSMPSLERFLRLQEPIMRFLFVRQDE